MTLFFWLGDQEAARCILEPWLPLFPWEHVVAWIISKIESNFVYYTQIQVDGCILCAFSCSDAVLLAAML